MKKRILGIALAGALAFSALAGSIVTASAEDSQEATFAPPSDFRLGEYEPSQFTLDNYGVNNLMFAIPGAWVGEKGSPARQTWEKYDSRAGLYWWGSVDNPDEVPEANGHGWPGWKMKKEADAVNLYSSRCPKETASLIFSNFIDGGMDTKYPEYDAAQQTKDLNEQEFYGEYESFYYPKEFWDYIKAKYPDAKIPEADFGKYAKNFFDDGGICFYQDNMVFVVDLVNTDRAQVSPVSPKAGLDGAFYFYYGNGEFGIWPTKELCIKQENLPTDDKGNVDYSQIAKEEEPTTVEPTTAKDDTPVGADSEEGTDSKLKIQSKTDFITNEHSDSAGDKRDFVVFGNFTGKYWEDNSKIDVTIPETTTGESGADNTTAPGPNNNDATSNEGDKSDSGSGSNDSNGSIATGDFSAVALIGVVAIAGLGVFYFIRRRRSSK